MRVSRLYIVLVSALLVLASVSNGFGAIVPGSMAKAEAAIHCDAPVLKDAGTYGLPFPGRDHNGAGETVIADADAVPLGTLTVVSPGSFAVVICLINVDEGNDTDREYLVPGQIVFHKVLFRSIISSNAP